MNKKIMINILLTLLLLAFISFFVFILLLNTIAIIGSPLWGILILLLILLMLYLTIQGIRRVWKK